jgi:hypothetical protein
VLKAVVRQDRELLSRHPFRKNHVGQLPSGYEGIELRDRERGRSLVNLTVWVFG